MPEPTATERAQEKIGAVTDLQKWIAEKGLTVEAVAKRLGVVDATVYNWLNGDTLPTGKALEAVKRLVRK